MGQPDSFGSDVSRDVDIRGPKADAEYGRGATFWNRGDTEALNFDPAQVESVFSTLLAEAERYRMTFEPIWEANYLQYHGETEDPSRAEWQSQVHVPLTPQAVDTAAARITSVMFSQEDWVDPPDGDGIQYDIAKELIRWQLDKAQAQDPINQSVKDALICGSGILKVHVETVAEPSVDTRWVQNPPRSVLGIPFAMGGAWKFVDTMNVEKRMRLEPIVPTDFWLDPSGQNRFYIQRIKRLPSDIWAMARPLYGADGKTIIRPAIYDKDVAASVTAGMRDMRLDNKAAIIRHDGPLHTNVMDRTVDLYEFWGDMVDPGSGAVLYKNIVATFVDKRRCIRPPERNGFLHRHRPYIYVRGKLLPHQIYGYGILGHTTKIQDEMDRLLRIFIDKTHLSIPISITNPKGIRNPEQLMGDHLRISPGKNFIRSQGIASDLPVVEVVKFCEPVNEWELQIYQILQTAFNMTSGVNEFVEPSQQTGVRKTRLEVQTKTQAAQASFNDAAQYIEQTALSPLVDMVYQLMIQFEDQYDSQDLLQAFSDNPQAQQFLQNLATMTAEERWRQMRLNGHFKVTGVTVQVTRQALQSQLNQFMEMVQADPTYGQIINKSEVMKIMLRICDMPRDILLSNWEQIMQAQQEQAVQAAQNPQPQQPGQPPQGQAQQTMMGNNQNNQQAALGARGRQAAQGQPEGQPQ